MCMCVCVSICDIYVCECVNVCSQQKINILQILISSFLRWADVILYVYLCNLRLIYVSYYDLYICACMPTCLTLFEYRYKGGNPPPSPLRGFEHLAARYLILSSCRHRQAPRCMRHLHWHSRARSRVLRHRIRRWPNLWTSYFFTRNPYTNST